MITYNNYLKILGRNKSTIVLSNGENVEPEPIEMRLQQSRFIDHCMVVGQDKRFLSILVTPVLAEFRQAGFNEKTLEELAENPEVKDIIRQEIRRMNSPSNGFKCNELIRDFRMLNQSFQVGEELTNLHKIKRHVVEKKYQHVIEELFVNRSSKNY